MTSDDGLYSSDFANYFHRLSIIEPLFVSVTSIDKIPKSLPVRHFVIVNLSPSGTPGTHWILIVRSHKKCVEVFNSLGYENLDSLRPFLKFRFSAEIEYNNTQVQKSTTATCGLFCIYFIVYRALNYDQTLSEIMSEIFGNDLNENENKVTKFCNHLKDSKADESLIFDF